MVFWGQKPSEKKEKRNSKGFSIRSQERLQDTHFEYSRAEFNSFCTACSIHPSVPEKNLSRLQMLDAVTMPDSNVPCLVHIDL